VSVPLVAVCAPFSPATPGQGGSLLDDGEFNDFATSAGHEAEEAAQEPLPALDLTTAPCGSPCVGEEDAIEAAFETSAGGEDAEGNMELAPDDSPSFGPFATSFAAAPAYPDSGSDRTFPYDGLFPALPSPPSAFGPAGRGGQGRLLSIPGPSQAADGTDVPGFGDDPADFGGNPPGGNSHPPGFNDIPDGPIGEIPPGGVTPTPGPGGSSNGGDLPPSVASLPEPTTVALMGLGLLGIVIARKRRIGRAGQTRRPD
jgi:hypothetical protein